MPLPGQPETQQSGSLISQPTAPLENKTVTHGLGTAARVARDPIPVSHVRPRSWARKGGKKAVADTGQRLASS